MYHLELNWTVFNRQSLLSPLTPSPARAGIPKRCEQDEQRSQPTSNSMNTSTAKMEVAAEGGRSSQPTPSTPNQNFAMSFDSFQEMLAVRTPGAFFKPIKKGEQSKKSATWIVFAALHKALYESSDLRYERGMSNSEDTKERSKSLVLRNRIPLWSSWQARWIVQLNIWSTLFLFLFHSNRPKVQVCTAKCRMYP